MSVTTRKAALEVQISASQGMNGAAAMAEMPSKARSVEMVWVTPKRL